MGASICWGRGLFASEQSPTGKIFGGEASERLRCRSAGLMPRHEQRFYWSGFQAATLKSFCIGISAHLLKIHPPEQIELPQSL